MTKNPYLNALTASGYIILVACIMFFGTKNLPSGPDTSPVAPIVFLSLFTLSAAVMGYIFFYNPVLMYLDGKKKPAVDLFFRTLLSFAGITILLLILFFSGALSFLK